MKFLVVGLGSMGRRRVRCLQQLGYTDIIGFDIKKEKAKEVSVGCKIKTVNSFSGRIIDDTDALIVSTPPAKHNEYVGYAIARNKPVFVELNLISDGLKALDEQAREKKAFVAPSCTMLFHPAIREITNIIRNAKFGKVTNFVYHVGQYLPDWHPWEDVNNFFVSKRNTAAVKEIAALEFLWITDIFGFPRKISGFSGKTMDIGADIDDTCAVSLDFGDMYAVLLIDAVSRYASRSLTLNMERGQILWKWDDDRVRLYDAKARKWISRIFPKGRAAQGYNQNIIEDMYVDELRSFIGAVKGSVKFPNSLSRDIKVLSLLKKMEKLRG